MRGQRGQNQAWNEGVFCHFFKFDSLVFFEIAYNGSLQQYLTSSRVKTHEKCLGPNVGGKGQKSGPKLVFFAIFSSLVH